MPFITVDRRGEEPLTHQVYERIRGLILCGTIPEGSRLLSTRRLAAELGVSRNIVMDAFDQLLAEGYVQTRVGAGTFAASGARFQPRGLPQLGTISARGFRPFRTDVIDFRSGLPDLHRFPVSTWQRLSRAVWNELTPVDLCYSQPEGRVELRTEIARYIAAYRGVRCHPEQVLVTGGTTQAVGIVSRLLLQNGGRTCILGDPVTLDIQLIVSGFGGTIVPARVDDRGMDVDALPPRARPAFIYATPSHQFPLGGAMPIQRRARLLEYARARGAYVIEDDYDSEFRYDSPPISSIQGLDPQRVVYIGTFSKTLCPSMRIGYVVFPPELVNRGREAKWFTDLHNSSVDQMILARFIAEGAFLRHVHAMKKNHSSLRRALVDALHRHFGHSVEVLGNAAGLHLCARFRGTRFTKGLLAQIESAGAKVYPVEDHAIVKGRWTDTIILGYGMLRPRDIEKGIEILAACLPGAAAAMAGGAKKQPRLARGARTG
jgi:GntR family transcriptional regulator / MocR family aminotransferase